jgi:hypothetical protein
LIPCYKSANLIAATLEAALKIFPPSHIYVIANGNSPTPLDNTEEVCQPYGVNHIWSPIGCKLVAQFVGCYAAKGFKNVLLIDDDCALPENFPVVTDRLKGNVMCLGYTIKSVGPNSSKGNYCQQAQDLEYKLSGLQREFAGKIGSATFPHGAIALWDRKLLVKTFNEHPGFSVSEDWFFGHVARELGSRITMCSQVFVETETPTAVFFSSGGSRGGFGEMTIFKQRFKRWNFFFVNGMYYNMKYILCSWKLGWWEIGAKIFVFQEVSFTPQDCLDNLTNRSQVYETLLYLLTPFILPISFYVRPAFCGLLLASTIVMYLINTIIFNEVHLRRKNERIGWVVVYLYYLPYKIILTAINVASCYWYVDHHSSAHDSSLIISSGLSTNTLATLQNAIPRSPKTKRPSRWSSDLRKTPRPRDKVWVAISLCARRATRHLPASCSLVMKVPSKCLSLTSIAAWRSRKRKSTLAQWTLPIRCRDNGQRNILYNKNMRWSLAIWLSVAFVCWCLLAHHSSFRISRRSSIAKVIPLLQCTTRMYTMRVSTCIFLQYVFTMIFTNTVSAQVLALFHLHNRAPFA